MQKEGRKNMGSEEEEFCEDRDGERRRSLWDSHAKDPEFEGVSLRERWKPQN
jgi:hypothetical protein